MDIVRAVLRCALARVFVVFLLRLAMVLFLQAFLVRVLMMSNVMRWIDILGDALLCFCGSSS